MKFNSRVQFLILGLTLVALLTVDVALRTLRFRESAPLPVLTSENGVVSAREFRLTDRNGNVRASMALDSEDEPGMFLFDKRGTVRVMLDTRDSTPSLILCGPNGDERVYFGMDENGDGLYSKSGPGPATHRLP